MTLDVVRKSPVKKPGDVLIILALVLILGRFVTQTYARMLTNSNSNEGDQGAYLQLSLNLREHGQLTDGTRNPLYPSVLALIAHRDWAFFTDAKFISMTFGILAIIALYVLGNHYYNRFTGLVAAYLLSINVEFIAHSATALTESMLVFIFILAWFTLLRALDNQHRAKYWVLAGVLAGLAYLAKGSGQLLMFAFLTTAFLFFRFRLFRARSLWLFLGSYIIIASPLWLYNTIHYGSPTFNYAITHQLWLDRWNDWHPDDTDNLPTLVSYLQDHSLQEIIDRQWNGMKAMRNILVKTLWPTRTLKVDEFLLSPFSGYLLAILAILPLIFWRATQKYLQRNGRAVYLALLIVIPFFMLFAWYVTIVALGQRFILPVIPIIFVLMAHITSQVGQKIMFQGIWAKRFALAAVIIVVILQLGWAIRTNIEPTYSLFTTNVFELDRRFNAGAATPLEWLVNQHLPNSVVAWGPSGKSLPTWAYSDKLTFRLYPPRVDSISALTTDFVNEGVDFVIVAPEMVSRYHSVLETHFASDEASMEITDIPPGWALSYVYPSMPCEWCVFRIIQSNLPQHAVSYQLGQAILLKGYDLRQAELKAGETVYLTLHWTIQAPINQNYTVFTQLLGPDFQLHGQLDNQPINNLWPTSRWQPTDQLADTYAIPIDERASAGRYQLLVGMYDSQTGKRLPIAQNGKSIPDDAISLTTIIIRP